MPWIDLPEESEELTPLQDAIHDLEIALFTSVGKDFHVDEYDCVLKRFIVCKHLLPGQTFAPPKTITPNLAGLQWGLRAVMYMEMVKTHKNYDDGIIGWVFTPIC